MLTRRQFNEALGIGAAGVAATSWIGARGREGGFLNAFEPTLEALDAGTICLASNENPMGPGKTVLDAIQKAFGPTGGAPGRYSSAGGDLSDAIAKKFNIKTENIVLGCGSTQILRSATHLFTERTKALVGTIPTYEECAGYADVMGNPVHGVPLDPNFKMDLDRMADAAKGAGLIFYCNPNNPTSTYVGARATREFLFKVRRTSPDTTVLVDEAYFDYVTDPDHETHIPLAIEDPHIIVARTFSKAYGMAGLRMGYCVGHPDTIRKMADWDAGTGTSSLNVLAMQAGIVAIQQDPSVLAAERERNKAVRELTMKWFADRSMKPTDSQANFVLVNIGRPAKAFREACAKQGVLVARDFPPYEKTHCRVSFGTMAEMQKALTVFGDVLGKPATAAAAA